MSEPYIGQISVFGFDFAPQNYALCNGQLLAINNNQALFALLGTTYGGDGQSTFALPNLQGRCGIHQGNGFVQGQAGGELNHALVPNELPSHNHVLSGSSGAGALATPVGNYPGVSSTTCTAAERVRRWATGQARPVGGRLIRTSPRSWW